MKKPILNLEDRMHILYNTRRGELLHTELRVLKIRRKFCIKKIKKSKNQ